MFAPTPPDYSLATPYCCVRSCYQVFSYSKYYKSNTEIDIFIALFDLCVTISSYRGRGGIGRRSALRSLWRDPWKFDSSRPHHCILSFFLIKPLDIKGPICYKRIIVASLAQLVEHQIVVLGVAGSIPVARPS